MRYATFRLFQTLQNAFFDAYTEGVLFLGSFLFFCFLTDFFLKNRQKTHY